LFVKTFRERRADGWNVVGRVRHQHGEGRNRSRQQHVVGADVRDQPEFQANDLAVALRREIHVTDDVAAMCRGHERLRTILDPLHRNAELLRDRGGDVFLGVDVDLRAEAAPNVGRNRADLILSQAGHGGDHRAQDVRVLRGRPDGHRPLARLEVRHHSAAFHRVRHQAVVEHALRNHDVCLGEGLVDGAVVNGLPVSTDARSARHEGNRQVVREVGMNDHRLAGHRQLGIHDRRQGIVGDDNGVGASRARYRSAATTTATASPAYRTVSIATA
jgi:hypothetical protein